MKQTGLNFYVEGEYVAESDWRGWDDPGNEDWQLFDNANIHPFGERFFVAWSQFRNLTDKDKKELTEQIITVVEWLYHELDWRGFDASLWLHYGEGKKPERVFRWELC